MNVSISIGGATKMKMTSVIVLYTGDKEAFATHHEVLPSREGPPKLEPAQLLTTEFLNQIAMSLGNDLPAEVFPANLLCRTADMVTWWIPGQTRTTFFKCTRDNPLNEVSGRSFPHPPVVMRAKDNILTIRALHSSTRPESDTPLYRAPYYNMDHNGRVCQGSMPAPSESTVETMRQWEGAFFGSNFTHPGGHDVMTAHKAGLTDLWRGLAGATGEFPKEALVPASQTLQQFIQA